MIVYIVTSGEYSEYSIGGVFSTKENAQKYIATLNRGDYDPLVEIEEWELDARLEDRWITYWVAGILLETGAAVQTSVGPVDETFTTFEKPFKSDCHILDAPFFKDKFSGRTVCEARSTISYEHAAKAAAEFRQKWLREKALTA